MALPTEANSLLGPLSDFGKGLGTTFYYIAIIVLICGLGALVIWWALSVVKWKFNVILLEEGADGSTLISIDKGALNLKNKVQRFRLKLNKHANPPVPSRDVIAISPKGKKTVVLRKIGEGDFDYIPLALYVRNLDFNVKPFTQDRINWIQNEFRENDALFGSFWDKYGSAILMMGTALVFIVGLIIVMKMNQDTMKTAETIGTAITNGLQYCSGGNTVTPVAP